MFNKQKGQPKQVLTPEEAEKIVQDFGGAVASLKPGDVILPLSALPYSKARIKYAFYLYIEDLSLNDLLQEDHANVLVQTYALLNSRFQKDADKINKLHKLYATNEQARHELKKYGGITASMPSIEEMEELNEFMDECSKLRG